MKAKHLFLLKDSEVPDSVQVEIHEGEGFRRFYFYDQTPGNFCLVIFKFANRFASVESHGAVGKLQMRHEMDFAPIKNAVDICRDIVSTLVKEGFGK